ncbi:DsbA family oxidoreductase [Streptomyces sp. NPDC005820]|uniref:DsbA family oxidoreductase n=1 Tax=Streptomyces sp. NPDC005820 TaxID=3157069 RepID=UPI0033FC701E
MKVEVYADFACAWCRLGMRRFERAVAAAGGEQPIELVHRPYRLSPDASEEPRSTVELMTEMIGSREQVDAMFGEMAQLGASEGVEYRFDRTVEVNTLTAHRLMWFAAKKYPAAVRSALANAVYDAHFRDGANIADHTELVALAESAGLDGDRVRSFLASDEGVAEVSAQAAAARRDGITSVPTFAFENGELLHGASTSEEILAALRRAAR